MEVSLAGDVLAWVTGQPRQRSTYSGRGDSRVVTGREVDAHGAPLSSVEAVLVSDALGVTAGATVVLPDALALGLAPGCVARLTGGDGLTARIVGGDFGSTRVSVLGVTASQFVADGAKLIRDAATKQTSPVRASSAAQ